MAVGNSVQLVWQFSLYNIHSLKTVDWLSLLECYI